MREVVFTAAVRTPIARIRGGLSGVRPDDLAAMVIAEVLRRGEVNGDDVDEVILGCANQAGEDNRNVARMATLLAGLPQSVPAMTINRLCASGLSAVNTAARLIACGDAEIVIAGGVESMSRAPWVMPKADGPFPTGNVTVYDSSLGWRFPNPALERLFPLEAMGETAENLVERYELSRSDQDAFALRSHRNAVAAEANSAFATERMELRLPQKKGEPLVVRQDEGPRADTTLETLAKLQPAFRKGGSVTAGNSSTLNDGASALILMSAEKARSLGRVPLGRWVAAADAGVDPRVMGIGPVPAVRKALARAQLGVDAIKLWELNEAFAAQSLAVIRDLELDVDRVNVNGGAIALGHPLGSSGSRLLVTLLNALKLRGGGLGLATLCVGVGQGVATVVEADP